MFLFNMLIELQQNKLKLFLSPRQKKKKNKIPFYKNTAFYLLCSRHSALKTKHCSFTSRSPSNPRFRRKNLYFLMSESVFKWDSRNKNWLLMPDVSFDVIAMFFPWKPTERKTEKKKTRWYAQLEMFIISEFCYSFFVVVVGVFSFFLQSVVGVFWCECSSTCLPI